MKAWYELAPDRSIKEAKWSHGSIFISASMDESVTTQSFVVDRKPKHHYTYALSAKNARRKFHKRQLI